MTANWNITTHTTRGTTCPVCACAYVPVGVAIPVAVKAQEPIMLQTSQSIVLGKDFMAHEPGGSDG